MKNITVSVDEETYRQCRIKAAEAGTSVSALVREFLTKLNADRTREDAAASASLEEQRERARRMRQEVYDSMEARGSQFSASDRLPRDELYNRDALR